MASLCSFNSCANSNKLFRPRDPAASSSLGFSTPQNCIWLYHFGMCHLTRPKPVFHPMTTTVTKPCIPSGVQQERQKINHQLQPAEVPENFPHEWGWVPLISVPTEQKQQKAAKKPSLVLENLH
eukprot:EG_transcript_54150